MGQCWRRHHSKSQFQTEVVLSDIGRQYFLMPVIYDSELALLVFNALLIC